MRCWSGDGRFPRWPGSWGSAQSRPCERFLRQGEVDRGLREGPTTEELAEIKRLRKEVADSQRTLEILKAATTLFVQEADPRRRRR
jgi:transposase-like protein